MVKVYGENDLVMCTKNPYDVKGLIIGRLYLVKSATYLRDEWVYGVVGAEGETIYTLDNFRLVVTADGCSEIADKAKQLILKEVAKIEKEKIEEDEMMKVGVVQNKAEHDPVNHPSHYTSGGIETIDVLQAKLGEEGFKGFLKGNIIKYVTRAGLKIDAVEDLKKAGWYLNKLIVFMGGTVDIKTEIIAKTIEVEKIIELPAILKVGDIVRVTESYDVATKGLEGKVIAVNKEKNWIGVEFFKYINGHTCQRKGRDGYCWNLPDTHLEVVDNSELSCSKKQRGYIYGLCKAIDLDPHNLPEYVSYPVSETRDMSELQASEVIDKLIAIKEYRLHKGYGVR